jgi:hypothetical protein
MSNLYTITSDDLERYPSLKGKVVGDAITAEEYSEMRAEYEKRQEKAQPAETKTVNTSRKK